MAAAQVAKKLKDKRQKRTMEEIFKKVDKDGNGSISLSEYFGIFEEHGIVVNKTETNRVIRLAGDDGNLTKESFIKILKSSDFFMKAFDKNKDGIVTETEMMTRAELAFHALDKDGSGYVTEKELKKLSKKLSTHELKSLMTKLDSDGDGRLSFEEFRVLFENAEKRKAAQEKPPVPPSPAQLKVRHNSVQAKSSCSRHDSRSSHEAAFFAGPLTIFIFCRTSYKLHIFAGPLTSCIFFQDLSQTASDSTKPCFKSSAHHLFCPIFSVRSNIQPC